MIELSDGNIALSSNIHPFYPIVIIDSSSYQIVTVILLEECIYSYSSLCVFDEHSFIYIDRDQFLQISNENCSILSQVRDKRHREYRGIFPLEGGKYFAIDNYSRISIIKPSFA